MTKYLPNLPERHPAVAQVAQWLEPNPFLSGDARRVSELFGQFTGGLLGMVPDGPELTAGLRKLVEAKDCAVRAVFVLDEPVETCACQTTEQATHVLGDEAFCVGRDS